MNGKLFLETTNMKKHILILGLALLTIGLVLISSAVGWAQSTNEFTVPFSDPAKRGKVKAHLNYGSITIKGTARKDVLVRYKEGDDHDDDDDDDHDHDNDHDEKSNKSKAGMKKIGGGGMDLEVVEANNYMKIQSDSWSNKVDLEIEVPSGVDLEVHAYNDGDVMITNIQGELAIQNYNGEITALNISGSVIATTYNGEIKVTFDKVSDNTPMSFSTYNGDIDLTFPSAMKASLKMKTEQGEILTDFDVNMTSTKPLIKNEPVKGNGTRVIVDDWKRGTINGGGAEFTMKNYNGDILLRKK
jgi:hypothetical protein